MLSLLRKCTCLLAVLWAGSPLFAEVVDININDEAARVTYIFQFESSGLEKSLLRALICIPGNKLVFALP